MKIKNETKKMDLKYRSETITKKIKKTKNMFTEDELDAIINALDWKADYTESLAIDCGNDCEEYDNWDDNYDFFSPEAIEERSMCDYSGYAKYLREVIAKIKDKKRAMKFDEGELGAIANALD